MEEFPLAVALPANPGVNDVNAYLARLQRVVGTLQPFYLALEEVVATAPDTYQAFLAAPIGGLDPGRKSHRVGVWAEVRIAPSFTAEFTTMSGAVFTKLLVGVVPKPNPLGPALEAGSLVIDVTDCVYATQEGGTSGGNGPIPGFPVSWWYELRAVVVALMLLHRTKPSDAS